MKVKIYRGGGGGLFFKKTIHSVTDHRETSLSLPLVSHQSQGVVTAIGAVVIAATGVKIFWPSFLFLDRSANGALTVWPHTLNTNCLLFLMLMAIKMQPSGPHYRVWKLSLTASWPQLQLWLQRLWEWPPLESSWPNIAHVHHPPLPRMVLTLAWYSASV